MSFRECKQINLSKINVNILCKDVKLNIVLAYVVVNWSSRVEIRLCSNHCSIHFAQPLRRRLLYILYIDLLKFLPITKRINHHFFIKLLKTKDNQLCVMSNFQNILTFLAMTTTFGCTILILKGPL